jgi:O-antigen/teichoic acid export membrane protein
MGWNIAVLRRVAVLRDIGRGHQASILLRIALRDTIVLGVAISLILICVSAVIRSDMMLDVGLAALVGVLWAVIGVLVSYLRALGDLIWSQICDGVAVYLLPLVFGGAMAVFKLSIEFDAIMTAYVASALLSILGLGIVIRSRWPRAILASDDPSLDARTERQLAHRLWWNQAFSALSGRASVLLSAPVAGVASTAIVEAGLRTQLVGATLAWAGGTVASPRYAVAHERESKRGARMLNLVTWAALLPSLAVVVALLCWGDIILGILGPVFVDERWAITVMAMAAVIELPASSGGYFLMMTGRERLASISTVIQLVVLVLLMVILGGAWGALGIAFAVLAAAGIRSAWVVTGLQKDGVRSPLSLYGLNNLIGIFRRHFRFGQ